MSLQGEMDVRERERLFAGSSPGYLHCMRQKRLPSGKLGMCSLAKWLLALVLQFQHLALALLTTVSLLHPSLLVLACTILPGSGQTRLMAQVTRCAERSSEAHWQAAEYHLQPQLHSITLQKATKCWSNSSGLENMDRCLGLGPFIRRIAGLLVGGGSKRRTLEETFLSCPRVMIWNITTGAEWHDPKSGKRRLGTRV